MCWASIAHRPVMRCAAHADPALRTAHVRMGLCPDGFAGTLKTASRDLEFEQIDGMSPVLPRPRLTRQKYNTPSSSITSRMLIWHELLPFVLLYRSKRKCPSVRENFRVLSCLQASPVSERRSDSNHSQRCTHEPFPSGSLPWHARCQWSAACRLARVALLSMLNRFVSW